MAETLAPLAEVKRIAEKAIANTRSMGVALSPCTVPAAGRPTFTLAEDEMEIGMGIHGEPGVRRGKLESADKITTHLVETILADMGLAKGAEVSVLVNGLGATPQEELYVMYRQGPPAPDGPRDHDRPPLHRRVCHLHGDGRGLRHPLQAGRRADAAPRRTGRHAFPPAGLAMRTTITSTELLALLQQMATDMAAHKDYLCALDGAMGDGDQGVTMAIGFGAIAAALPALADQDIGTILTRSGLAFNGTAASTIGALFATACLRAGKVVKGKTALDLADLAAMAAAACTGIQARGKAQLGDKTVLDALVPTVAALQAAAARGTPLEAALAQALAAAEAGVQATIPLKAQVGRAAWLAERSVGHPDPGATSFTLMLKSAVEYLTAQPAK